MVRAVDKNKTKIYRKARTEKEQMFNTTTKIEDWVQRGIASTDCLFSLDIIIGIKTQKYF